MEKLKKIIIVVMVICLVFVIFVSGVILVDSFVHKEKIPSFFGWKPFIVLSGSMETEIMTGDLVIVKEIDTKELKENDIIAFKTSNEKVITHRIVEKVITEDGTIRYKTKGDKNNIEDPDYVLENQIEGIYKFRIAGLGNLAISMQKPIGMIVIISIPLIFLLIIQIVDSRNENKIMKQKEEKTREMEEELQRLRSQNKEKIW